MTKFIAVGLIAAVVLWFTLPAAAASAEVVAARNVLQTAVDLDKTVAFYRALGLDIGDLGADGSIFPGKRLVQRPEPSSELLVKLTGVHDSKFRGMAARIPSAGFDLELVEFAGTGRKEAQPRIQDRNATFLVLTVRNIDAALNAAKKAGGSVVTAGGAPLAIGPGKSRSVLSEIPMDTSSSSPNPIPCPRQTLQGSSIPKRPPSAMSLPAVSRAPFKIPKKSCASITMCSVSRRNLGLASQGIRC